MSARRPAETPEQARERLTSAYARRMGLDLPEVAPDVYAAVYVNRDGSLTIPTVYSADPGKGNVGRWIDSLADKHVTFVCVINWQLAAMLRHRGYTHDPVTDNCERRP